MIGNSNSNEERVYRVLSSILRQAGIDHLSALDALESHRGEWLPEGYAIAECGSCKRSSIVPTGESLRKLRLGAGCTQADVAAFVGCERGTICFVEKGRRSPSDRIVQAYYEAVEARRKTPKEPPPR